MEPGPAVHLPPGILFLHKSLFVLLRTRSPAVAEKADRTALSGIGARHADRSYSRRRNFNFGNLWSAEWSLREFMVGVRGLNW